MKNRESKLFPEVLDGTLITQELAHRVPRSVDQRDVERGLLYLSKLINVRDAHGMIQALTYVARQLYVAGTSGLSV